MNSVRRFHSSVARTLFSSDSPSSTFNNSRTEDFPILNRHLSSYQRFDLSGQQQDFTASVNANISDNQTTDIVEIHTSGGGGTMTPTSDSKRTLRTVPGVFCPIALSMFSIVLFMRLGFVIGHAGVLQTLLQFGLCFVILFATLLSVCAIATNGAIEGGGIYYMISRALGPEFGGAIGVLFFFANVIGNGQCVAALVEALLVNFGPGSKANAFYDGRWWRFLYGTLINLLNLIVCLLGSSLFSMATFFIFILVCFIYLMVVVSFFVKGPVAVSIPKVNTYFYSHLLPNQSTEATYTGFSSATMKENTYSNYTIDYTTGEMMNFATVFGVLFSSITGLLAGANMSGELKRPSRSIPIGSVTALLFVFFIYITETLLIAGTTSREALLNNYLFLQDINIWQPFVVIGIIASVFSACLSGLIGASRILEALAIDEIFGPVLRWIRAGTTRGGNPWAAVMFSFILVELTLLGGSMNSIAPIVTIFFLLAYFAVNLSCLALDLASAPNFRPSFRYFSWHTAILGTVGSIIMCFIVSPSFASIAIGILIGLIAMLHLRDFPRASWGSISQALIFHQVRKYLLLLDPRKEHVKFWRPQMLLLVSNPRSAINLIDFVNDMKKGGLYILGHVKIGGYSEDTGDACTKEYPFWLTLIDNMKIKAFVDMTLSSSIREGVLQLIRLSGLGGLRPNTVILGFYDNIVPEDKLRSRMFSRKRWKKYGTPIGIGASTTTQQGQPSVTSASTLTLHSVNSATVMNGAEMYPIFNFEELRQENEDKELDLHSYVQIIKDALYLKKSVCLARNFHRLQKEDIELFKRKVFVDIWPVNFIFPETSTQFDVTCLYMLQLATILHMVKPWKTRATLRVFLCIDAINDNSLRTQQRLDELLRQLRINAQTRMIAWENVTSLRTNSTTQSTTTTNTSDAATLPFDIPHQNQPTQSSSSTESITQSFIDTPDSYIRGINELIRQQCDNTSCLFMYLPKPPHDKTLAQRYIRCLDLLSNDLPPVLFVHGVSSVTCTHL